ncbi:hypothetical protein FFLO_03841 [Filobasidium floriforme]|uniref:Uncharacterized protein n=2 Tax=Filobasidium floriforme TaxID=5210 RepID=A0A8K0NSS3_9TREE|nr:hypothetical protein FFLO_03841 [Filobasidium floriforme]
MALWDVDIETHKGSSIYLGFALSPYAFTRLTSRDETDRKRQTEMSQSDEERNEERDEDCTPPEYKPLDDPVYLLLYPKLYAAAVALVELGSQFSLRSEWNSEEIFWKSSTGDHGWIELDQHRFDDCIDALLTFKAAWVRKYFPCYRSGGMYGHHLTAVNHSRGGYLEIDGDEFELLIKFHYSKPSFGLSNI